MMNMRWSETTTLEFVRLYLKHECLWNPANRAYKLKRNRDKAYSDIAETFTNNGHTMNVYEVKSKIKNLRTTYCQQVSKILRKSLDPDNIYEPTLIWFKEMDQCLKNVPPKRHSDVLNALERENSPSNKNWEAGNDDDSESNQHFYTFHDSTFSDSNESITDPIKFENLSEQSDPIKVERRKPSQAHTEVKKRNSKFSLRSNSKSHVYEPSRPTSEDSHDENVVEDEFDIYGKHVASQLRRLSLSKALKLQLDIQNIICEARLSDIK